MDKAHFDLQSRYLQEMRAAAEPWEKQANEYKKFALEFSKLIVTNLYVVNAGGLISLPALSAFLGISALAREERIWILGWSAAGFAAGLICAALCSLFVYFNYHNHAQHAYYGRTLDQANASAKLGFLNPNDPAQAAHQKAVKDDAEKSGRWVNATYRIAHLFGYLSVAAFLTSAIWLGVNLR